ncbi:MAG: exodeoxyribonuclease V subunit alpha [Planctomycetota bacterium]|nr:exodeoxyribonuclease V subunit alpha [Planctomycetota bacterium]
MSGQPHVTTLGDLHAELLTRLATGGDRKLLAQVCRALGEAREEGDVCIDLAAWCSAPAGEHEARRPDLAAARDGLLATGVISPEGGDEPRLPLVLDDHDRLYTLRHFRAERRIARFVDERLARPPSCTPGHVHETLAALSMLPHADSDEPDWQLAAVVAGSTRALTVLCGGPGTGKTTTVAKLMSALLHDHPDLRVAVAAPTGKAAARLGEALAARAAERPELAALLRELEPQTLHRMLGYVPFDDRFRYGSDRPLPYDLVVIDEVSMADAPLFAALCDALAPDTRLVLVGDKNQLAAVAAGQILGDLTYAARPERGLGDELAGFVRAATGMQVPAQTDGAPIANATVSLRKNHRFRGDSAIGAFAAALVERDPEGALAAISSGREDLALTDDPELALREFLPQLELLLQAAAAGDAERALAAVQHARVLTAMRLGPTGARRWNEQIEQALSSRGHRLDETYYVGRPILITANDQGNRVWNGDLGVCGRRDGQPVVWLRDPRGEARALNPRRLPAHETAWAMTVHKAQGSEFEHVLVVLPDQPSPLNHASLVYTGVTRARRRATICASSAVLEESLRRWPSRRSGLAEILSRRDP